jgi:hypothetical protein
VTHACPTVPKDATMAKEYKILMVSNQSNDFDVPTLYHFMCVVASKIAFEGNKVADGLDRSSMDPTCSASSHGNPQSAYTWRHNYSLL